MFEIHVILGTFILSFGIATVAYLIYKLLDTRNRRTNYGSIIVLLSETLIAVIIGILHIYCYTCSECSQELSPEINELLNQTFQRQENSTVENCETTMACIYQKMFVEQLILTIAAIHSFVSLITSSMLCKDFNKNCSTIEETSSSSTTNLEKIEVTNFKAPATVFSVVAQWLLPTAGACFLCYVMNLSDAKNMCETTNSVSNVPDDFQNLVSELLDNPINITEKSVFEPEIERIVGKVYSIVDSVTQPSNINEVTNLDEGFQLFNILEKLNSQNRKPKQMNDLNFSLNNTSFKIYTMLLLLLGFVIPIIYSNISYVKLKTYLDTAARFNDTNNNNLYDKIKYLKMSIISAAILWSPSFMEMFSRTFITQNQPNAIMHILMIIGSSYMLVRYGINLKLAKSFIGRHNSIVPKV